MVGFCTCMHEGSIELIWLLFIDFEPSVDLLDLSFIGRASAGPPLSGQMSKSEFRLLASVQTRPCETRGLGGAFN